MCDTFGIEEDQRMFYTGRVNFPSLVIEKRDLRGLGKTKHQPSWLSAWSALDAWLTVLEQEIVWCFARMLATGSVFQWMFDEGGVIAPGCSPLFCALTRLLGMNGPWHVLGGW